MRRSTPRAGWIALAACAGLAAAWPGTARAASCYQASAKATDICFTATSDAEYASQGALSPATAVFSSGAGYFLIGANSSVRVIDIADPMSPASSGRGGLVPKWSFECEGNHTYLTRHVYVPATLDDFPYAFVPLSHWGWDWVGLSGSPSFLGTGLKPGGALDPGIKYTPALFRHGSSVYLVGYQLDPTALAANDMTIYMYKVADGANLSPLNLTPAMMAANRVALPTGSLTFSTSTQTLFQIHEMEVAGGTTKRLLIVRTGSKAAVVDLTNPALPSQVAVWSGGDSRLWANDWALDWAHARVMVETRAAAVLFFDMFDPSETPGFLYQVALPTVTATTKYSAIAGDLAVVGAGDTLDYLNLGASPPEPLPSEAGFNTLTRTCTFEAYGGDVVFDVGAFVKDGVHYAVRALMASSDFVRISNQCISSEPEPYLTVTPPAGTTADCATGGAINVFPGDALTLADTSGGEYTTAFFHIEQSGDFIEDIVIAPHGDTTWTPPGPGTYTIDLVIGITGGPSYDSADYGRTKTVAVCDDPEAAAAVTKVDGASCPGGTCDTWLQGQQLTVSGAASEGNPSGYDWFVLPPSGSGSAELFSIEAPQFDLAETGEYHVFLIAHYGHTPPVTGDDTGACDGFDNSAVQTWLSDKTEIATANLYDSCAYLGPLPSQPFSLGEVAVSQNGAPRNPYLAGEVINLEAPYAISTGWTPTFAWSVKSGGTEVYAPVVNTGTAGVVKGSIPANQLGTGAYTVALHGSSANGDAIGPEYDRSASINVAVCAVPGQAQLVAPSQEAQQAAGNITFTWKVPSGTGPFTFEVWNEELLGNPIGLGKLCTVGGVTSAQGTDVSCVANISSTTDWLVRTFNACSPSGVDSETWTVNISSGGGGGGGGGGGTCTAQPAISSVSISPSQPKTGEKITLTANGVNLSTASVTWKVTMSVLGQEVTVASASGNPGTINGGIDAAGQYTVTATAMTAGCATETRSVFLTVTEGQTCTPPTVASVTVTPSTPAANQPATFAATVAGATGSTTYAWTFKTAGGLPIAVGSASGNPAQFTFTSAGTYTAEVVATNDGCASPVFSKSVTVTDQCDQPTPPVASFTYSPSSVHVGETVQFTDSSVNGATAWAWRFGDGPSSASSDRHPTHVYQTAGTFTVKLTASNCKGENSIETPITVLPPCSETAAPTAAIDWQEKGTFEFHGQTYTQPYVGQTVHLLGSGSNGATSYNWYDFGDSSPATTQQNPTHVWTTPGTKNLRMRAKNCFGESEEAFAQIQIYSDSRPVLPAFEISSGGAQAEQPADAGEPSNAFATGTLLTFTAATGYEAGDPTKFVWNFGDGSEPVEGNPVTHVYECRGVYTVTLSAGRHKTPGDVSSPLVWGTATATATIDGEFCGPEAVIAAGAAKVPGFNGTSWRTDMHIFNASESNTEVRLGILPAGQSNPNPFEFGPYTLGAKATLVLRDILGVFNSLPGVTADYTKAAIRIMYENDEDEAPVVMQRTYTDVVGGGTYGQFIPGVQVVKEPSPATIWLTGLRNTGLESGFRTNVGLTHLKGDVGDVKGIALSLLDASGAVAATTSVNLAPYGFLQESLVNLFGAEVEQIGAASLKIDVPAGAQLLAYYSEIDNLTGDPFLVTGSTTPEGKVLVPGMARLAGEAGTLWRTDLQLTNGDGEAHTWELKFFPKGDVPVVSKTLPIEPGQSVLIEDAVQWIYQPFEAPDASGVMCVLPLEANDAMPAVSARTYNLTPSGTYGQSIVPLDAARGATAGSGFSRLYLTGMSTEDVARTNLGFVNLGASTVNFDVYFYDRDGDLLNPDGAPYTFALGVNGWDQDKLENRFHNFFGAELPPNQEAISAVIVVKSGGPGFAYASVIDSVTGDPMLVPAQLAP